MPITNQREKPMNLAIKKLLWQTCVKILRFCVKFTRASGFLTVTWPNYDAGLIENGNGWQFFRVDSRVYIENTPEPYGRIERKRINGKNRLVMQATGLCISIFGNIRRHQWLLGLWSVGRGVETERQGAVVEQHDPAAG